MKNATGLATSVRPSLGTGSVMCSTAPAKTVVVVDSLTVVKDSRSNRRG